MLWIDVRSYLPEEFQAIFVVKSRIIFMFICFACRYSKGENYQSFAWTTWRFADWKFCLRDDQYHFNCSDSIDHDYFDRSD